MPEGHVVTFPFQNDEFTDYDFNQPTFLRTMDLLACRCQHQIMWIKVIPKNTLLTCLV